MKRRGQWHPPKTNDRIVIALDIFNHLSSKRKRDIPAMGGSMIPNYISESEIQAYMSLHPDRGWFDDDWLLSLIYAADDEYMRLEYKAINKKK